MATGMRLRRGVLLGAVWMTSVRHQDSSRHGDVWQLQSRLPSGVLNVWCDRSTRRWRVGRFIQFTFCPVPQLMIAGSDERVTTLSG